MVRQVASATLLSIFLLSVKVGAINLDDVTCVPLKIGNFQGYVQVRGAIKAAKAAGKMNSEATCRDWSKVAGNIAAYLAENPIAGIYAEHFGECACRDEDWGGQYALWHDRIGLAQDIGAGGGAVWVIGSNPHPDGYGIYRWTGSNWHEARGAGVRIAVDDKGRAWVINNKQQIYYSNGDDFTPLNNGGGLDIAAGGGALWLIGANPHPDGFGIYRWTGSGWQTMPGAGVRIAVDNGGNAWVVNNKDRIFRWNGGGFDPIHKGAAKDIGAGGGAVWVIGSLSRPPYGYSIHQWNGSNDWNEKGGGGVSIAVDNQGKPWVTNNALNIYQWP